MGHLREKHDPIVPYDLRHTFGTLAVRTAPLSDVQSWMGHQDIQTTMRYVHYVPRHDAAAKLTAAFKGLPNTTAGTKRVPKWPDLTCPSEPEHTRQPAFLRNRWDRTRSHNPPLASLDCLA